MKIFFQYLCLAALITFSLTSCDENSNQPSVDSSYTFAKGADISWLPEMEADNVKFYKSNFFGK